MRCHVLTRPLSSYDCRELPITALVEELARGKRAKVGVACTDSGESSRKFSDYTHGEHQCSQVPNTLIDCWL